METDNILPTRYEGVSMKNADMPAMPVLYAPGQHGGMEHCGTRGMTKREAFAMAAMQGFLANSNSSFIDVVLYAKCSVEQANALLAALEAQP